MCEVQIVKYIDSEGYDQWRVQLAGYQHLTPTIAASLSVEAARLIADQYARCIGWPIAEYIEHIETVTNLERVGEFK